MAEGSRWLHPVAPGGLVSPATSGSFLGTVTSVSVVSANGFSGSVATPTTTPAITLSTTISGIIKGNGTAISAATAGTDYAPATSGTSILKGNGSGGFSSAVDGTDFLSPSTGVLLSNVTTTSTASKVVQRDANANIFVNNDIKGYTTTATAGTTTTLTVASTYNQYFTGSTNQTVQLPDATTLYLGFSFRIHNNSTGAITVQNATPSTVWVLAAGTQGIFTCTNISTAAGVWDTEYLGIVAGTTKKVNINNSLTFQGTDNTTFTFPSATDTVAGIAATQTFTNKTYDTAGAGNVFKINGTQITAVTGTGSVALATSPAITTPAVTTGINDANAVRIIGLTPTASATTYVNVTNNTTGTAGPTIAPAGETNIDLNVKGAGTGKVHYGSGTYQNLTSDTDGATVTFDMSASNTHTVTLGGNRTLALSNVGVGQLFMLNLVQDATGSRTVTWFSTIKWAGGTTPTLTTTANKTDSFGFQCTSTGNYIGYIIGQNI